MEIAEKGSVEKEKPASLCDLELHDQLFFDIKGRKMHIFINRENKAGLKKELDGHSDYKHVFGDRDTDPGNAMLVLWSFYRLETSVIENNETSFILIVGSDRPRLN